MFLTVHTTAALMISQHSSFHLQAFLYGLLSHVILDIIPHGDVHFLGWIKKSAKMRKMILISEVDIIISTIIAATFFYSYYEDPSIFV